MSILCLSSIRWNWFSTWLRRDCGFWNFVSLMFYWHSTQQWFHYYSWLLQQHTFCEFGQTTTCLNSVIVTANHQLKDHYVSKQLYVNLEHAQIPAFILFFLFDKINKLSQYIVKYWVVISISREPSQNVGFWFCVEFFWLVNWFEWIWVPKRHYRQLIR